MIKTLSRAAQDKPVTAQAHAGFRPDIQGLRAIAVLLVLWYHLELPGLTGGFIGVDVFFVISGYLITGLLTRESDKTGRIDLLAFYARRARRLLPAALVMILVTLGVGTIVLSPLELTRFATSAFMAALYASNFHYISSAGNYFAPDLATDPFLHTWSLAVEEQFYLVWPLLVALSLRRARSQRPAVLMIALVTALTLAACIWATSITPKLAFFSSPLRAWEFGIGGLASFLMLRRFSKWSSVLGAAGLLMVVGAAAVISSESRFPGLAAVPPVIGTAIVLVVGGIPGCRAGKLLGNRVLTRIGELSYSWYLWHWPVLLIAQALYPDLSLAARIACGLGSLVIAEASYRFVENPIRFSPVLTARSAFSVSLGLALSVTGASTALAIRAYSRAEAALPAHASLVEATAARIRASRSPEECVVWNNDQPEPCPDILVSDEPTIVVFGDSHARMWLPAFREIKRFRLISMTKSACPSADIIPSARRFDPNFTRSCLAWRRNSLRRITSLKPALVVVANSQEHVEGSRRKANRTQRVTSETWSVGVQAILATLSQHKIPVLLIRDTPRLGIDVPICLSRAIKQSAWRTSTCDSLREEALDSAVFAAELQAAREFPGITVVDPADNFCDAQRCYPVRDGLVTFYDFDHVAPRFAASLAREVESWVHQSVALPSTF